MPLTLGFIGLVTQNMAASLAFYRALGVTIPADADQQPHVEATLADGTTLAWDTVAVIQQFDADYVFPRGSHRVALAFHAGTPAAVDARYAELVAAGHHGHVAPWNAHWGQRYATLLDPDGNSVDLYAELLEQ